MDIDFQKSDEFWSFKIHWEAQLQTIALIFTDSDSGKTFFYLFQIILK